MSTYEAVKAISAIAGADFTAAYGKFVIFTTTANNVVVVSTTQGDADGICAENVASGASVPVVIPDSAKARVLCGGTFAAGDLVASDNAGKCIIWVDAVGNKCLGRAITAGASGSFATIQFSPKKVGAGS